MAGIDGLRGVAVLLVFAFHLSPTVVPGGFLGVSLFFTISGFVITNRLLDERESRGAVSVVAFAARRARRILPAAAVTIVVTLLSTELLYGNAGQHGRGALAAALSVRNWWQLGESASYGDLFQRSDPLDHYWSLSIEEQFYVVFPVLALLTLRRGQRTLLAALIVLTTASVIASAFLIHDADVRYFATHARVAEILIGCALAIVMRQRPARSSATGWGVAGAAPALAALLLLAITQPLTSPLFRYGFAPVAILSAVLIAAVMRSDSNASGWLAAAPIVWVGHLSYSLYLVHWPLIALLEPDGWRERFAVVTLAVVLASCLHYGVERPTLRLAPRRGATIGLAALALAFAGSLVVARSSGPPEIADRLDALASTRPQLNARTRADDATRSSADTTSGVGPMEPRTTPIAPRSAPIRVGFVGDSVAMSLALAIDKWTDDFVVGPSPIALGCGMARFVETEPPAGSCVDPAERLSEVGIGTIDVAVVVSCQWELLDRTPLGSTDSITLHDEPLRRYVLTEYDRVAEALRARGVVRVLWATCPPLSSTVTPADLPAELTESRERRRVHELNGVVRELASTLDFVRVLDLERTVGARIDDATLRPDGSHFEYEVDTGIADAVSHAIVDLTHDVATGAGH